MQETKFNCQKSTIDENVYIISLGKSVLGGTEAMEFSKLLEKLANDMAKGIIIDMQAVEVINSSGLGMLVNAVSVSRKNNFKLAFINIPQKVKNLLSVTHLDQVFKIYQTETEAINSF